MRSVLNACAIGSARRTRGGLDAHKSAFACALRMMCVGVDGGRAQDEWCAWSCVSVYVRMSKRGKGECIRVPRGMGGGGEYKRAKGSVPGRGLRCTSARAALFPCFFVICVG